MKSRSTFISFITIIAAMLAVSAVIFAGQDDRAARPDRVVDVSTGLFGITPGESASLNLVNAEPRGGRRAVDIEMLFLDADGSVLKSSPARVAQGHSAVLLLPYSELGERTGRVHIRAMVLVPEHGCFIPSLEVFDNSTGRTEFIATLADVL